MEIIKSFAKINIGLNITSKREDGYHNISTIFYKINLFDEIIIEESNNFKFEVYNDIVPTDNTNLIIKTKNLFEKYFDFEIKFNVQLKKNIPIFAGLGGGSSNAGYFLKFLAKYFDIKDEDAISNLALNLGSDVPFFLKENDCYGEGRGELLTELPNFKLTNKIILIFPNIKISTKDAYNNLTPSANSFDLKLIKSETDFRNNLERITNDFENYVFAKYPIIAKIKNDLSELGCFYTSLSGSGSAVYGFYDNSMDEILLSERMKDFKIFLI